MRCVVLAGGTGSFGRGLTVGFISHDISDHPTSHLVEGIFSVFASKKEEMRAKRSKMRLVVFSYGHDDGSVYRRSLENVLLFWIYYFDSLKVVIVG